MPEPRECPVCQCEFRPTEEGQKYCSPWCERSAKDEQEQ
jgi:hypothetical protein